MAFAELQCDVCRYRIISCWYILISCIVTAKTFGGAVVHYNKIKECVFITPFISVLLWSTPLLLQSNNITIQEHGLLYICILKNLYICLYKLIYKCISLTLEGIFLSLICHIKQKRPPVIILLPNNSVCVWLHLSPVRFDNVLLKKTKCHLYSYVRHHVIIWLNHCMFFFFLPKSPPSSPVSIRHVSSHDDGWCCPHCKLTCK